MLHLSQYQYQKVYKKAFDAAMHIYELSIPPTVRHIEQINRPFLHRFPTLIIFTCSIWRRMTCKFHYSDDICTCIQ